MLQNLRKNTPDTTTPREAAMLIMIDSVLLFTDRKPFDRRRCLEAMLLGRLENSTLDWLRVHACGLLQLIPSYFLFRFIRLTTFLLTWARKPTTKHDKKHSFVGFLDCICVLGFKN